eukprot:m51a1_g6343 hypothetical protein (255) ;mRNA; f:38929-39848
MVMAHTVAARLALLLAALCGAWAAADLAWRRQYANCASCSRGNSSLPTLYMLWSVRGQSIDVGVYGAGTGTSTWIFGYVAIAFQGAGNTSATFHSDTPDIWMGIANGTYCANGCVEDAAVTGPGVCSSTRIGVDPEQDLTDTTVKIPSYGAIQFEFSRLLDTGDALDTVISITKPHDVYWSVRAKVFPLGPYPYHSKLRDRLQINFGQSRLGHLRGKHQERNRELLSSVPGGVCGRACHVQSGNLVAIGTFVSP